MAAWPRQAFLPRRERRHAGRDAPLPIGHGQTISQPWVVARMTELARNGRELDGVLEIGTGCGYQTAVLARVAAKVWTVERIGAALGNAMIVGIFFAFVSAGYPGAFVAAYAAVTACVIAAAAIAVFDERQHHSIRA